MVNQVKPLGVMSSLQQLGTLGSVAFLFAATLYQENHDRNHNIWNIGSTATGMWLHINSSQ